MNKNFLKLPLEYLNSISKIFSFEIGNIKRILEIIIIYIFIQGKNTLSVLESTVINKGPEESYIERWFRRSGFLDARQIACKKETALNLGDLLEKGLFKTKKEEYELDKKEKIQCIQVNNALKANGNNWAFCNLASF